MSSHENPSTLKPFLVQKIGKRILVLIAISLLTLQFAYAESNQAPLTFDEKMDDCTLFRALNGSETVPDECYQGATKSAFGVIQEKPETPQPIILGRINFEFDSARLTQSSRKDLMRIAKAMRHPVSKWQVYQIGGHTDASGDDAYNLKLSQERADSVRRFLTNSGHVSKHQLRAKGYGPMHLLMPEEPFNSANRRVEITNIKADTH